MPTCTRSSVNVACFDGVVLNPFLRKALMVYLKAAELNAIGGTNYLNALITPSSSGLLGAANSFLDEKTAIDDIGTRMVGSFELAVQLNNALAAGVVAASIQTRMQNIKCLMNVNENMLDRMNLFLDCQLGVHKSYPQ